MKVFISWSGNISHQVALVFRDWLPRVIQSIEPYVSSEDIDKGARWSTDIAKELEHSTFGILCVTKENMNAPWLAFEAGALSKAMDKSLVTPFLFDIRRSEVNGPMLQFQSTIFEKQDLLKLVTTLNRVSELPIHESRLKEAFEVWYSRLEQDLHKLKVVREEGEEVKKQEPNRAYIAAMTEEILELSRNNQKLLHSPELKVNSSIEELKKMVQDLTLRMDRGWDTDVKRSFRRLPPAFFEELLQIEGKKDVYFGFNIILSLFQHDFPWIHELGKDLIVLLKSDHSRELKEEAIRDFRALVELSLGHPLMRDLYDGRKDGLISMRNLIYPTLRYLENILSKPPFNRSQDENADRA